MLFVLGQVYDRELKDATRAIETYQGILDIDHEDLTAIQALDRLYQQTGRWYDLLQILEREVELSSSTGETVSLKHRIGQLWERELKDLYAREAELQTRLAQNEQRYGLRERQLSAVAAERDAIARRLEDLERELAASRGKRR